MRKPAFAVAAGALALALALTGCGGGGKSTLTTTVAPTTTSVPTTTNGQTKLGESDLEIIPIEIKGGKPVGGIKRVEVKKGWDIDLVVQSDVADEVHLHGYDKHVDVDAGGTAHLTFTANIAGVFEAELESRSLQIVELTVR